MHHELSRFEDSSTASRSAAAFILERAKECVAARGVFHFAVSGGRTPWAMFEALSTLEMPWGATVIYQVDERAAPLGSAERNLTNLRRSLASVDASILPMPVEGDLEEGARAYEGLLPAHFDLVHLGLGPDGHTASLVADDPVLDVAERLVGVTGLYQGWRRMTLTYPALAQGEGLIWLVLGEPERRALDQLRRGDESIPAGRVRAPRSTIFCDRAAAP